MKLLAVDCSFGGYSLALLDSSSKQINTAQSTNKATEGIIASLDEVLCQANIKLNDLDTLACGIGPGNFSGIRASCAVAQGIAHVHNLEIISIKTTQAQAYASDCENALVVYPAHRGHCYLAGHEKVKDKWLEKIAPKLIKINKPPSIEGDWQLIARGEIDTSEIEKQVRGTCKKVKSYDGYLASAVAELAVLHDIKDYQKAIDLQPLYVRDKVALTKAERAAGMTL